MDDTQGRIESLVAEVGRFAPRGWTFTQLGIRTKRPLRHTWNTELPASLDQVVGWARAGHNIGLRCGLASGVAVLDVDGMTDLVLPPTATVAGARGYHYYYKVSGPLPNPVGKIASSVDLRGDGGQVVFPGSIHPTGVVYRWQNDPEESEIAEFPVEVLKERDRRIYEAWGLLKCDPAVVAEAWKCSADEALELMHASIRRAAASGVQAGVILPAMISRPPPLSPPPGKRSKYVAAGVRAEYAKQANRHEGGRNSGAFEMSLKLSSLAAATGEISLEEVKALTLDACEVNGVLQEDGREAIEGAIDRGIAVGAANPRKVPARSRAGTPAVEPVAEPPPLGPQPKVPPTVLELVDRAMTPVVLVPGEHVDDMGRFTRVSASDFQDKLIDLLPADVYRRGGALGVLKRRSGELMFSPLNPQDCRRILSQRALLKQWVPGKKKDDPPTLKHINHSLDHGDQVIQAARDCPRVKELRLIVSYPVFVAPPDGREWEVARPGLHGGIYSDTEGLEIVPCRSVDDAVAILNDAVVDFPFRSQADKENFFGLMLTPMIRTAIDNGVPMHLVEATREGTGKGLLIERVFGITMTGRNIAASQISSDEDEMKKKALAALLQGATIWNLDNVEELDSPSLASLITARVYSDRVLGLSQMVTLPNELTITATGNNVRVSWEIARRTVPIRLVAKSATPERRKRFKHPNLDEWLMENRPRILGALVFMVKNWIASGSPAHWDELGSFNQWSRVVGGILNKCGLSEWRTNERAWRLASNTTEADNATLLTRWLEEHGHDAIDAREAMSIAETRPTLFLDRIRGGTENAKVSGFMRDVLRPLVDRVIDTESGTFVVRSKGGGSGAMYRVEKAGEVESEE